MTEDAVRELLVKSFPEATIAVIDITGQGSSFDIRICSDQFNGKTSLQQHRLVYTALGDAMKDDIHAVKLNTLSTD